MSAPVQRIKGANGWELRSTRAFPRGATIFTEAPWVHAVQPGSTPAPWRLVDQVLQRCTFASSFAAELLGQHDFPEASHRYVASTLDVDDVRYLDVLSAKHGVSKADVFRAYVHSTCVNIRNHRGLGLYRYLSCANHSCSPNFKIVNVEEYDILRVKALHDIAAGEALTFSYSCFVCDEPLTSDMRQEELLRDHGFLCACATCEARLDTVGLGTPPEISGIDDTDFGSLVCIHNEKPEGAVRVSIASAKAGIEHCLVVDVTVDGSSPPMVRRSLTYEPVPITDSVRRVVEKIRVDAAANTLDLSRITKPSVSVKNAVNPQTCACGAVADKWCARCNTVAYCSKACQKADWIARHKQKCTPAGTAYDK